MYKLIRRFVTGLVLALLWDRFFNAPKLFSMKDHAFFVLGAVFFALAWVNYLKIDGVRIHYLNENRKKPGKTKPRTGSLIDFIEEEPAHTEFADLSDVPDADSSGFITKNEENNENEETKTALIANLLAGLGFMLVAFVSRVFL